MLCDGCYFDTPMKEGEITLFLLCHVGHTPALISTIFIITYHTFSNVKINFWKGDIVFGIEVLAKVEPYLQDSCRT